MAAGKQTRKKSSQKKNARNRKPAPAAELRKRMESSPAVFKEVIDTAAQGLIAVDRDGRIVMVNDAASEMFGYSRKALLNLDLSALIPEGVRRLHSRHVGDFFRHPRRRPMGQGIDLEARRKDGSRFPVEVALSMVEVEGSPVGVAFVSDISGRKAIEDEVSRYREQLSQLTSRIVTASEEATRAWARELHDVYSQRLAALSMRLSHLAPVEAEVRSLAEDIHSMSRRMHPGILHDLGLVTALRAELDGFQRQTGIETSMSFKGQVRDVPEDVALCLYRIAQESLHNIGRHSGAEHVALRLRAASGRIALEIADQGDGFDIKEVAGRGGLGLISMEERARAVGGDFSIDSTIGAGTTVNVVVPIRAA